MKLFGGGAKKKERAPTTEESIQQLRATLEMLEKREKFLESKIQRELEFAKKNAATNKRGALLALKRKKSYEAQIDKLLGARSTIEQQLMSLEGASVNLQTLKAMEQGSKAMKNIHGEMDIDRVDQTMDDIQEQMDLANEISDAISQPLGTEMWDDAELEAELEELGSMSLDEQLLSAPAPARGMPVVAEPVRAPASRSAQDEEAELRALESSMMM